MKTNITFTSYVYYLLVKVLQKRSTALSEQSKHPLSCHTCGSVWYLLMSNQYTP